MRRARSWTLARWRTARPPGGGGGVGVCMTGEWGGWGVGGGGEGGDGGGEPFTGEKVLAGLVKAAGKRPVSIDALEALVLEVEREIRNRGDREIPSLEIGEMVMERLRHLDDVAYVRFASEHSRFEDVDTLVEEIETLKARKAREAAGRAQVPLIPLPNGTPEQE